MTPPAAKPNSKDPNRVKPEKEIYECSQCDFQTNWRPSLSKHKRTHAPTKAFKCFACDYKSTRRDTLVLHYRCHTGIKPYGCDLCDYRCSLKTTLKIHRKTHTNDKSYECSMCEKVFVKSCFLKFHEKGHMREAPNNCNVPKCTCKNKANVKLKPYVCKVCPYRYACLSNLNLHKRRVHNVSVNGNSVEENVSESESENGENMSEFYAEFDNKELSELELPPSLYQQLIDEESLCSVSSNFPIHKKHVNKSLNATDSKDKTEGKPVEMHKVIVKKSLNANNPKHKTNVKSPAFYKIIHNKSLNATYSKTKTELKIILCKSLNGNDSKDKMEEVPAPLQKIIINKSLIANDSKDKTDQKSALFKIIHSKSLNADSQRHITEKNTAESKNAENLPTAYAEYDESEMSELGSPLMDQQSHKIIYKKPLDVNSPKNIAEHDNDENSSSFYADFDKVELSELELPPSLYQQLIDEESLCSLSSFVSHKKNKSLNANDSRYKTEEQKADLPKIIYNKSLNVHCPRNTPESENAENLALGNAENLSSGNAENLSSGNAENLSSGNAENLSSGNAEINEGEMSESGSLPPFDQQFHKIIYNKSLNTNKSKNTTECDTAENLYSVNAESDEGKVSEVRLPPPMDEQFHKIAHSNLLHNNISKNTAESENGENLYSVYAELDQNKLSELELPPPMAQQFHVITHTKSVIAKSPRNTESENGENVSSVYAELDQNKLSELELPPPVENQFHVITHTKFLNANDSKYKTERPPSALHKMVHKKSLNEKSNIAESESAEFDIGGMYELDLPPTLGQQFHVITHTKSLTANDSKYKTEVSPASHKMIHKKSLNANSCKIIAESENAEFDIGGMYELELPPPSGQQCHKIIHTKSLYDSSPKNVAEENTAESENEENTSLVYAELDQNRVPDLGLPTRMDRRFHEIVHSKSVNAISTKIITESEDVELDIGGLYELELPSTDQQFHRIIHEKSLNASSLNNIAESENGGNLSLFYAEFTQNKVSELPLQPIDRQSHIIIHHLNNNSPKYIIEENTVESENVENSTAVFAEFEMAEALPLMDEHNIINKKPLDVNSPKNIAEENTEESENAENLSLVYAEFEESDWSELELPPSAYQLSVDEEFVSSLSPDSIIISDTSS